MKCLSTHTASIQKCFRIHWEKFLTELKGCYTRLWEGADIIIDIQPPSAQQSLLAASPVDRPGHLPLKCWQKRVGPQLRGVRNGPVLRGVRNGLQQWRWAHPCESQKVEEQTSRFATYLIKRSSRALLALDWVEVPAVSRRGVFHDNPQAGWGSDRKLFHHLLVIFIKAIVDPKVSYGMWQKVLSTAGYMICCLNAKYSIVSWNLPHITA